jgi:diguanylate cyclase (GGDEF)-like protein
MDELTRLKAELYAARQQIDALGQMVAFDREAIFAIDDQTPWSLRSSFRRLLLKAWPQVEWAGALLLGDRQHFHILGESTATLALADTEHALTVIHAGVFEETHSGRSRILVQLLTMDGDFGVLGLCGPIPAPEERHAACRLASLFARSLRTLAHRETIEQQRRHLALQATRHVLTGLFNRRYADTTLPRDLQGASRRRQPFALASIDLDGFKRLNDRWGHEMGDLGLKAVAQCLQGGIRRGDLALHWGGDEFLVAMPDTPLSQAVELVGQMQRAVEGIVLPGGGPAELSFSAGMAGADWVDYDYEALLRQTDAMLYWAKQNGKRQINAIQEQTVSLLHGPQLPARMPVGPETD